jgi:hypothetical protein
MVNKAMLVRPGGLIRRLGSFEEYIWLLERRISRTIVLLAEVQGATTPEDWRTALNRVQARHTILSSRIRKDPGSRPYFELAQDVGLPLEVVPLDSGTSALERCSRELGTLVAFLLLGCSSSNGSSGNPAKPAAQTYTLTVTATSGADAHTTTLTLIVQ